MHVLLAVVHFPANKPTAGSCMFAYQVQLHVICVPVTQTWRTSLKQKALLLEQRSSLQRAANARGVDLTATPFTFQQERTQLTSAAKYIKLTMHKSSLEHLASIDSDFVAILPSDQGLLTHAHSEAHKQSIDRQILKLELELGIGEHNRSDWMRSGDMYEVSSACLTLL